MRMLGNNGFYRSHALSCLLILRVDTLTGAYSFVSSHFLNQVAEKPGKDCRLTALSNAFCFHFFYFLFLIIP